MRDPSLSMRGYASPQASGVDSSGSMGRTTGPRAYGIRLSRSQYGVDIRTQPFDKDTWYKLRGEYVTQLFRELHKELSARRKKLSIIVWGDQPNIPMGWQS